MFVQFLVLLMAMGDWQLEPSGIYRLITTGDVLVDPDGGLYVLQRDECLVKRFDANGKFLYELGGKGKGPGEFEMPTRLFYQETTLYVLDLMSGNVSLFDSSGEFMERVRLSNRGLDVVKVANGWVYGDWNQFEYDPDGESAVWWADESFENAVKLFGVVGRGAKGTFVNDGTTSVYSPVSATPKITVNHTGTKVFVTDTRGLRLRIVDPMAKKVISDISRKEKIHEFNPDWANVRLEEVKLMMPKIIFKTNYPEYFPVVRSISFHPGDWLVVDRWTRDPANLHDPLVLDERGREVDTALDGEALNRWVGTFGEWAYVAIFDAEKREASIERCPISQVARFVRQHPIPEEER